MKSSFFVHIPQYPVNRFVQFIWISKGGQDDSKSRVLPNGTIELILNFGDIQKTLDSESFLVRNTFKNFWVAGIQGGPLIIQSESDTDLLGIRFKPGGAYPFFKLPVSELFDQVVEADWLKTELDILREQVYELNDDNLAARHVEQYLLEKLGTVEINIATNFVLHQLANVNPPVTIEQLIAKTGYSHKHMVSLFKQQVGISPKLLQRILRFQEILRAAKVSESLKWNDILYAHSFFDPSHFVNDFKKLSGITPDQYLASKTFDENHCLIR